MTLPRGCDLETDAHPRWFLVGVFLTCMCGLMLQIIETRVLSVLANYTLAFVAISVAMLDPARSFSSSNRPPTTK
jgi:hypothetical protein